MTQPIQRVEELFQTAADLPREQRAAFLERECPDPELRVLVQNLLRRHEQNESLAAPRTAERATGEGPGTVIGRYKLLQHIGEGGFGSVYMAEQTQPVVRKVALKIIKLGMDTREVVARLEAERQALALMDHPNIAKVLDGGATESGRPYFVMELVRGISITEYCDQANLLPRERLELFVEVCQAVQHAHQKGVLHRDIKPSNVLVTLHDGKPVPKVIDFGIAKAMHGRLTDKTLFTEFRQFIGTPAYMSPEQAEMSGLDIDTRSDIYALGVLLYELLTGTTPFDTRTLLEAGYGELQRIIREEEPPRPSVRISTQGSVEIARHRRLDVPALTKLIRGDLDWIAMRALEKDRARRYASASELAEDVRRHLRDEPVEAGPPGATYRVRKFLVRNRAAVAWAATIAVALVAGITGTTWGLLAAARERDQAVRNRALAEARLLDVQHASEEAARQQGLAWQALDQAHDVTTFLSETLALSNPMVSGSAGMPVRELLDRAAEQVGRLGDQPYAEASVRGTIGRAYRSLSEHRLAEPHLRRASALMRELPDYDAVEHYQTLWALTITLFSLGANDAAETANAALRVGHDAVRVEHPALADLFDGFIAAAERHDMDEAAKLFDDARVRAEAELDPGDPLWLVWVGTLQSAGYSQWYSPFEASAEPFWREALAIQTREIGATNPETAESLAMLVGIQNRSGRAAEAEERVRESVRIQRSVFGPDHVQTAFAEAMLAENLVAQGRFEEAEPIALATHEILVRREDETNFCAVDSLGRMVALYDAWQKPEKAAPYRAEIIRVAATGKMLMPYPLLRRLIGPDAAELASALDRLQALGDLMGQGPVDGTPQPGALVDLQDTLAVLEAECARRWPTSDPMSALLGRMLGQWCNALEGRVVEANRARMAALGVARLEPWRGRVPAEELANALALDAQFRLASGEREAALEEARAALALVREVQSGKESWNAALAWLRVGRSLQSLGVLAEAEELLVAAHARISAQLGPEHGYTRIARGALRDLYAASGRADEAAKYIDAAR